jgi:anti-sigma B factor antagonist
METRVSDYGNVLVYSLTGYLKGPPDGYQLLETVRAKIASGTRNIIVEMSGVEHIDSSGIGVIAAMVTSGEKAKATILFSAVQPRVMQLLKIVHLAQVLRMHPSLEAALASLAR